MSSPDDAAVKKLKDLTSQLDKATAAGKEAVKTVASARAKAATAMKVIKTTRRQQARKRARKKR